MFRFAHIEYLNLLYIIPVLVLIYWFSHSRKNQLLKNFANLEMHELLFPLRSKIKGGIKFALSLLAIILLISQMEICNKLQQLVM